MNAVMQLAAGPTAEELIATLPQYRGHLVRMIFSRWRIPHDDVPDLLQETFLAAIHKIRHSGLEEPDRLAGYLFRTALNLTKGYRRRVRIQGSRVRVAGMHVEGHGELLPELRDERFSPEDLAAQELLARAVSALLKRLPVQRDREVLERLYLREEPRESIRDSLGLDELQFNNIVWRAKGRLALIFTNSGMQP